MLAMSDWVIERRPALVVADPSVELLRWQDPRTPLQIWQIGPVEDKRFRIRMGAELAVDVLPMRQIIVRPCDGLPQVTIDHFLADQVFPRLLAHMGRLVIHAGAVRIGDEALMFVGQSGRGKSTLVASFDQSGPTLIGDDAMVVSSENGQSLVRPVYPSLRLMPDSIEALMPGSVTAGPVAHYSSKQRIDIAGDRVASDEGRPLRAIFAIGEANSTIDIRPLTAGQACMTLVENSFALDPSNVVQARDRLAEASTVARHVPVFDITYPRDYARLPEVRQAILDQISELDPA